MARNGLAGKGKVHNRLSPTARKKKQEYDAKFQKKKSQVKKRVEANRANRKAGTYGKMTEMGKDRGHQKDGTLKLEDRAKNRGKKGEGGRKKKS
jgi:hypothetical protein